MGDYKPTVWVTVRSREDREIDPYPPVPTCTYCNEESMLRYTDHNPCLNRLLCHTHYKMHRRHDPWLDLVDLVNQSVSAATNV